MKTAQLDFRSGRTFHYCMTAPDGREMWDKFVDREIVAPERILWVNSFSAMDGGITRHPFSNLAWPLQMLTEASLVESEGKTTVTIKWTPLDAIDEERQTLDRARDGMTQGWTGTFDKLSNYLAKAGTKKGQAYEKISS